MEYVYGEILTDKGFINGYIGFEKKIIKEISKDRPPKKPISKGLIIPSLINFHTHLGDSFIRYKNLDLPNDLEKLVAPPDGIKHNLLNESNEKEIIEAMKRSIQIMQNNGTRIFCDFREGGMDGLKIIKKALAATHIKSILLSRPKNLECESKEIKELLKNSDGIGLSSISDWNYSYLSEIAKEAKKKNKIFAIHGSERIREDIDKILDLKPNFLIHMNKATKSDLIKVKENNIPIVICPRSNKFFGMKPNYKLLKKTKIELLLGTDNCMLNSPNILDEIKFLMYQTDVFSFESILKMATISPRKALNLRPVIPSLKHAADFIVIEKKTKKILYIS